MSRIDREYKKAVEEEKKTEAQIKALQLHLEETVVRRQQLAREALVKAFENKKLGRDEFFDVVEGISSGELIFCFPMRTKSKMRKRNPLIMLRRMMPKTLLNMKRNRIFPVP